MSELAADFAAWSGFQKMESLPSPALIFYPQRIAENISRMIKIAGSPDRLWPHIKTHKCEEIVRLQIGSGIRKFKCATIAECEIAAAAGAERVLLAQQPTGPATTRLAKLSEAFPGTRFACLIDHPQALAELEKAFSSLKASVELFLDLDVGMKRSGIPPGAAAVELYRQVCGSKVASPGGLHVYDGQIHDSDLAERTARCEESFAAVLALEQTLENARLKVPALIAGGTPTFPVHAKDGRRQLSPGTCLLWDWGYSTKFPDLDFLVAATLLTRVISKPASNRLCLDLGHKAVASENPLPRLFIPALPEASHVMHSEEHLVVETHEAEKIPLGTPFLCIPRHICPSVALYSKAYLVRNRTLDGTWAIRGRERTLQF